MSAETTPAVERGAAAADRAVMGYTRPDGTYVQGAVNFWDDSVENGGLIARDVLAAALDVEEMACALYISDHPYDTSEQWRDHGSERAKDIYRTLARAIRTALLGADS